MAVAVGVKKKEGSVAKATPPILEKVETVEKVENVEKVEEKPKSTRGRKKKS